MDYTSVGEFLRKGKARLAKGPVALIFVEDEAAVEETLAHHLAAGFREVVAFLAADAELSPATRSAVIRVPWDLVAGPQPHEIVNRAIKAAPGTWFYYCYNAEFLFFPFSESRNVAEMITFTTEEKRASILTFVVDLYAGDLARHPSGVSLEDAMLDRTGYYALARTDRWGHPIDRQMDFFGGLRWRLEQHMPKTRRRIDRVALFQARAGLELLEDHTFNEAEYNTYACPWHNSMTAAICSFRTAKALKRNPGSTFEIESFNWHNSVKFDWKARQLMDLGLMEPGQWF
ncbi:MAG: glycosyltransferase family 2 protein [Pseudomonadota bacterium]